MKVSIITTVYKAEKDLPRLLDSMMALKSSELEFFLIDNGSPDRCGEICREYAQKDSRFVVYTLQENIGYIRARNLGIEVVDADYVGFCDSDDYMEPGGYDKAIETIKKTDCDLYLTAYHTVSGNNSVLCTVPYVPGVYDGDEIRTQILPQAFGSIGGKPSLHGFAWKQLFKRKVLIENNISFMPELQPYEDQILNIDMIRASNRICVDNTVIYNYVVNVESITAKLAKNFKPEEEWSRLKLFYLEKKKRATEKCHYEAVANQMVGFLLSMVLHTARMDISVLEAGKQLAVIDKPTLEMINNEMSLKQDVQKQIIMNALLHGWFVPLVFMVRVREKVRKRK